MRLRLISFSILISMLLPAASSAQIARNIILVIGDGMGYEHTRAASYYLSGSSGKLSFDRFYRCGVTTYPADSDLPDSAAAASAIATGCKVNRQALSVSPEGRDLRTILEAAKGLGKSTGLVTTTPVSHATPAAFASHRSSRYSYYDIAYDIFCETQPDVLFGGGNPGESSGKFLSSELVDVARRAGYATVYDCEAMDLLVPKAAGKFLGLFAANEMPYEYDRTQDAAWPHLSQMAAKAIELLDADPQGFFLMIEGGKIDYASEIMDIKCAVHEVVELHNTVRSMLEWMNGRSDTLLIVTADHETGGLEATNQGRGKYPKARWSIEGHTSANVPLYTTGPGSSLFNLYIRNRLIDNTDISKVMLRTISQNGWLPNPPAIESLEPGESTVSTGSICTFSTAFSDPDGRGDLASCFILIDKTFQVQNRVVARYDVRQGMLYLLDDTGTRWLGGFRPGTNRGIENSYCKLYCNATTLKYADKGLTVNWRILLKPSMARQTCEVWSCVIDQTGLRDGWNRRGQVRVR